MTYKKRCNNCIHVLCDVVGRNRPERNVDFVCESIVLFERNYGAEYKEETRELALDAISKYGPGTPFENDERMLPIYRILGKYSRSMSSTDIYDKMHEKGLFLGSARFYADWVDVHVLANQMDKAKAILVKMEAAVGAEHETYKLVQERLNSAPPAVVPRAEPERARANSGGPSKIAALVKPASLPPHPARRNLFGVAEPVEGGSPSFSGRGGRIPPEPIVEDPPIQAPVNFSKPVLPPPRDESIVLPNIVEAPPIDLSIVSPSMSLLQLGQVPSTFSLPPVFSFAAALPSATQTYKPAMTTTTQETTVIRSSIMSTSMNSSQSAGLMPMMMPHHSLHPPPFNPMMPLSGLPSHPGQIVGGGQSMFAVPLLPPQRFDRDHSENKDPRGAAAGHLPARRDITGILMPSRNIPTEKYGELEREPVEPRGMSAFELKKARLQNQNQHSMAARKIFSDPAVLLENAFQSLGINSPSTSNQQ